MSSSSFLGLEGYHVVVTGAAGGIGSEVVREFLSQGCKVTALDLRPSPPPPTSTPSTFHAIQADISSEPSISSALIAAAATFGPINILCANAGITDESAEYPLCDLPAELWDRTYAVNVRGTFLTIKHFLKGAEQAQKEAGKEVENLAIVVTGSECGKFGQEGHAEYASGKAGLQYGLVRTVKNEIVKLNGRARINAVAPGWVNTGLIEGRLDDPNEMWAEAQATVPLRKIAEPSDVARLAAFLASHRAAGHISGECVSVDGGMEGRLIWKSPCEAASSSFNTGFSTRSDIGPSAIPSIQPAALSKSRTPSPPKPLMHIALSVDFDAVSGWMGTGAHTENNMADHSTGFFSGEVGVPRLLRLFKRYGIEKHVTWFVPGHSMESFPEMTARIVRSGAEIALHGYCHEGADQLTPEQEHDVLVKCIAMAEELTGKRPVGYRAPLYHLRESTVKLLEDYGFEYDSSLTHHDSIPYHIPHRAPVPRLDFSQPATTWMYPLPTPVSLSPLVEIPANWYGEDMTPLQFWPHTANSQGYVSVSAVRDMWKARYDWVMGDAEGRYAEEVEEAMEAGKEIVNAKVEECKKEVLVFPLILHPDTSGMAHVIGMVEEVVKWLAAEVEAGRAVWMTYGEIAKTWRERQGEE